MKKTLTPVKAVKLNAKLTTGKTTFVCKFNQDLAIEGKVKNTNYGYKVNLTLAKAHRILKHYKVKRKFKCPAGIEHKNLYLVLRMFEAALETICREVFPHASLVIPLPDVVRKATGGLCAEDLVPSAKAANTSESEMEPEEPELLEQRAAASAEPQTVEIAQTAGGVGIVNLAITPVLFAATAQEETSGGGCQGPIQEPTQPSLTIPETGLLVVEEVRGESKH